MKIVYTYIPEKKYIPRKFSVAAVTIHADYTVRSSVESIELLH
jgi:hypothetical protein